MGKIAILILAAGKSSRMKDIKQLLKIENETLIDRTIKTAKRSNAQQVFCVLGANAITIQKEITQKNIDFIFNKNYQSGLSSSIVCGVEYIQKYKPSFDAVLILLIDQPDVNEHYVNELIDRSLAHKLQKIIATKYPNNIGVPAIFPKKYFKELQSLEGDKGAKSFLKNYEKELIYLKKKKPFIDLDFPNEYASYIKSLLSVLLIIVKFHKVVFQFV